MYNCVAIVSQIKLEGYHGGEYLVPLPQTFSPRAFREGDMPRPEPSVVAVYGEPQELVPSSSWGDKNLPAIFVYNFMGVRVTSWEPSIFEPHVREPLRQLALAVLEHLPNVPEEDAKYPFFTEAVLYPLVGKDNARTLLALFNRLCKALGTDMDRLQEGIG